MAAKRTKTGWRDWLIFRPQEVNRATIRRHYQRWRQGRGLPTRCDSQDCDFYISPLVWNGKRLKPVLDHINGNRLDNRPENLQLLCPNCESQLSTRGGGNRGRVTDVGDSKFTLVSKEGRRDSYIIPGNRLVTQNFAQGGGEGSVADRGGDECPRNLIHAKSSPSRNCSAP